MGVCNPDEPMVHGSERGSNSNKLLKELEVCFNGKRVDCKVYEEDASAHIRGSAYIDTDIIGERIVCTLEHKGSVFMIIYNNPASAGIEPWMARRISREIVDNAIEGGGEIYINGIDSFRRYLDFVFVEGYSISNQEGFGIIGEDGVIHVDIYGILSGGAPEIKRHVYVSERKDEAYSIQPHQDGYIAIHVHSDAPMDERLLDGILSLAPLVYAKGGLYNTILHEVLKGEAVSGGNKSIELSPGDILFADIYYLGNSSDRYPTNLEKLMNDGYVLFNRSEEGVVLYTTHTHDIYGIPQKFLVVSWVGRVSGGDIDKDALISAANETIRLANSEAHLAYHRATFACTATAVGVKN